jgi:hypothetical protein
MVKVISRLGLLLLVLGAVCCSTARSTTHLNDDSWLAWERSLAANEDMTQVELGTEAPTAAPTAVPTAALEVKRNAKTVSAGTLLSSCSMSASVPFAVLLLWLVVASILVAYSLYHHGADCVCFSLFSCVDHCKHSQFSPHRLSHQHQLQLSQHLPLQVCKLLLALELRQRSFFSHPRLIWWRYCCPLRRLLMDSPSSRQGGALT